MGQYGKNFYGASYYGLTGTLGGQYTSEETFTGNPLTGTMVGTVIGALPRSLYLHNSDVFSYSTSPESYEYNGSTYSVISGANSATIQFVGSDFSLVYLKHSNGAKFKITISTYVNNELVDSNESIVDTNGAQAEAIYNSPSLRFGSQIVVIIRDGASLPTQTLYLRGISARTTDFLLQVRSKTGIGGEWSEWGDIQLSRTVISGMADSFTFTGNTVSMAGKNYYQFRMYLGTSDSDTTPIIHSCKFTSGNTSNYAAGGTYKMRMDITSASKLKEVHWNANVPDGTSIEIRTRTAATEPLTSWTSWSAPYSDATARVRLKSDLMPQTQNPINEYIITPLLNPQDPANFVTLINWIDFVSKQYVTDPGTSIKYEILDRDFNKLTYVDQVERYMEYILTGNGNVQTAIGQALNRPIRLKVSLRRDVGYYSSPVVDQINYKAKAKYLETKIFAPTADYKSYGSAVYNNNTGISDITFGDTAYPGDGTLAKPSNLSFTIPTPVGSVTPVSPTYSIADVDFQGFRAGEELNFYWKGQSNNVNKALSTSDPEDIPVVQVRAWPDNRLSKAEAKIMKHYQYGRGYIVWPNQIETVMTNAFQGAIPSTGAKYSYCLLNGWQSASTGTNANQNVVLRWKSQQNSLISDISEVNGSRQNGLLYNDTVVIGVNEASVQGEIPWVSEEKIYEATVNDNGIKRNKIIKLTGDMLPIIPPDANVGYNPYHVEIVYRSVKENGRIVPSERLMIEEKIDDIVVGRYPKIYYTDDSFEEMEASKQAIVKDPDSPMDRLRHSRVLDVKAIFKFNNGYSEAGYYTEGLDYQVVGNSIDWSIAYNEDGSLKDGRQVPAPGVTYYVTYTYERVASAVVEFRCDYKEKDTIRTLWTSSNVVDYEGTCTPGHDFRSSALPEKTDEFVWGAIPQSVDKSTLFYVLHDDNIWVSTFLDTNDNGDPIVVGTLRNRVPSLNWFPRVNNGYYYIGKDEYFFFTEPTVFKPSKEDVEMAKNVQYMPGKYGNGIFIGEGTVNLVSNPGFEEAPVSGVIFSDTFIR